jgi:hypothetical protein
VTFTLRKETCPPVKINDCQLPQVEDTKYLGMYLDRRLTWKNTYSPNANNLDSNQTIFTGSSAVSQNYPWTTRYYCTSPSLCGRMEFSCGELHVSPILTSCKGFKTKYCVPSLTHLTTFQTK